MTHLEELTAEIINCVSHQITIVKKLFIYPSYTYT